MNTSPEQDILRQLSAGIETHAEAQTLESAAAFALAFPADTVLALDGDLGAGKTTFMKGMARAWEIEGPIVSPTYNLFFQYSGKKRNLVHLDAYGLEGEQAAEDLLIEEFLDEPWCLAIEWPAKAKSLQTPRTWHLSIQCSGAQSRRLLLKMPRDP